MENKEIEIKKTEFPEPKIEESTTYDDRRKVLIHKSVEDQTNELGDLHFESTAKIHEEGIKKTIKNLVAKRKVLKDNVKILIENLEDAPKMTPELEELKKNLTALQLIKRKEKSNPNQVKKDKEDLEKNQKDLEMVEGEIKEIKDAVGSRIKF